jgi:hypothetical protein
MTTTWSGWREAVRSERWGELSLLVARHVCSRIVRPLEAPVLQRTVSSW